jgi:hypothetical protein
VNSTLAPPVPGRAELGQLFTARPAVSDLDDRHGDLN